LNYTNNTHTALVNIVTHLNYTNTHSLGKYHNAPSITLELHTWNKIHVHSQSNIVLGLTWKVFS
jgi:hypothetical protein